jgi:hypothetical protein
MIDALARRHDGRDNVHCVYRRRNNVASRVLHGSNVRRCALMSRRMVRRVRKEQRLDDETRNDR